MWNLLTLRGAATWAILAAVAALLFVRLGDRLLWGDEAETALLARNITRYGWPRTDDGVNRVTLYGSKVDSNRDQVWVYSPWLDEYLIAASFLAFGPSTWAARFPCSVVGLVSVALLGQFLWRRHQQAQIAWMGMIALGSMELFILHTRQARYYSLIVLAQIILLHGLLDLWEHRPRGKWLVAASLLIQFYSNYIMVAANLPALLALAFCSRRRIALADLAWGVGLAAVGAVPWVIYAQPWLRSEGLGQEPYWIKCGIYARELHFHILPLFFLLWPLAGRRRDDATNRDALLLSSSLFFVSFVLVIPLAPGIFTRYLIPLAPLAAVWVAECIGSLRWRSWANWLLFLGLTVSNLPAWIAAYPVCRDHRVRVPLVDVLNDLTHQYSDQLAVMADYFNAHARPGEKLLSPDPEFPLMFHTKLRVFDARFPERIPAGTIFEWILPESVSGQQDSPPFTPAPQLAIDYEEIRVTTPASDRKCSIPEPDFREYRTNPATREFVLYRRK